MSSSLLLIFSILTFACSNGERKNIEGGNIETTTVPLDTVHCVNNIKKQYADINTNAAQYDKVEKDIFGQSSEGGVMIAFYDKKYLKKIISTFYGETGQATTEYYFDAKGELFFIFRKTSFYDKPMYIKNYKVQSIEESRYYFCQNELVKWLGKDNKPVSQTSKEFQDEAKFLKEDVEELQKIIADYTPSEMSQIRGDTVRCKYGSKCLDSGFIIKGSREVNGKAKHVKPLNKNVQSEK